jgi:hypothetical protein
MLWAFTTTYGSTGTALDGLGGFVLADGKTLDAVRPVIRMGFLPLMAAWRADSKQFYLPVSLTNDTATGTASSTVAISTHDYVAAFDADGTLLGTRLLGTWGGVPSTAFTRMVKAMAASNDRVYVLSFTSGILGNEGLTLFALDATSTQEVLPVVASISVATPPSYTYAMQLGRNGRLSLIYPNGRVDEYTTKNNNGGDSLAFFGTTTSAEFDGDAVFTVVVGTGWNNGVMQNGPRTHVAGGTDDTRRFFLQGTQNMVRGYRSLDKAAYTLDISSYAPKKRYRLANVGYRPKEKVA